MWRCLPRITGFDASPSTSATSSADSAPPAASTSWKPRMASAKPFLARSVTSLSSHVPAAFQAEPARAGASSEPAGEAAASAAAMGVGVKSFLGSAVGFHSRCLYHVMFSSLSTTLSSSLRSDRRRVSPDSWLRGRFSGVALALGSSGLLQQRLWNCQSSFWHCAEQYDATLHTPHRMGLATSLWQLWQCGFSASFVTEAADVDFCGFSSSESSMLSNLL
mmetsp:Transcript_78305/g.226403  ORF Transcript_78305/g.226403 Transcript_78305/m.226403 type:complete len:220 (-) Transcript_78305:150-809(-)